MKKMKNLIYALVVGAIAMTCSAVFADTFRGSSSYTKLWSGDSQEPRFYDLEQLGVRKAAEDNAVQNCLAQGHTQCYPTSSQISGCNYTGGVDDGQAVVHCDATAIAISAGQ
jgi:hypothetical protein